MSETSMVLYGIKNCNTVKNAMNWLSANKVVYTFHDYKTKGISYDKLRLWCGQVGWEELVNKRGTTWKQLSDEEKSQVVNAEEAIKLMMSKTSVIKRPLIEREGKVLALGFDEHAYSQAFNGR